MVKQNRYPGRCERCGGNVGEGEGEVQQQNGRWLVHHRADDPACLQEREARETAGDVKRAAAREAWAAKEAQGWRRWETLYDEDARHPYERVGQKVWRECVAMVITEVSWQYGEGHDFSYAIITARPASEAEKAEGLPPLPMEQLRQYIRDHPVPPNPPEVVAFVEEWYAARPEAEAAFQAVNEELRRWSAVISIGLPVGERELILRSEQEPVLEALAALIPYERECQTLMMERFGLNVGRPLDAWAEPVQILRFLEAAS